MQDINAHKAILINILRSIYTDTLLRTSLGFKGGTAALLFYDLPRFSVDLDFDLLDTAQEEEVFARLKEILPQFGVVKEARKKRYTLFFLLSYQKGERNLKVEISRRGTNAVYTPKNYLGISVLVMAQADMAASKLSAVLTRRKFATRDLFDLWFFLKNQWSISPELVTRNTGLTLRQALKKAEKQVTKIKKIALLAGLGDLLDNKQKNWVREHLKEELIFQLKLYETTSPSLSGPNW